MGRYINLGGMQVVKAVDGQGVRVELVERPCGSTRGIQYVRLLRNGVGESTEQFSGYRAHLAEQVFTAIAKTLDTPAKATSGEEVVFAQGDVRVIKVSGKPMTFRIEQGAAVVNVTTCAPQSWRKTQAALIAQAQAL